MSTLRGLATNKINSKQTFITDSMTCVVGQRALGDKESAALRTDKSPPVIGLMLEPNMGFEV
jgi:hypothetical protein